MIFNMRSGTDFRARFVQKTLFMPRWMRWTYTLHDWITPQEAADKLGCSPETLRRRVLAKGPAADEDFTGIAWKKEGRHLWYSGSCIETLFLRNSTSPDYFDLPHSKSQSQWPQHRPTPEPVEWLTESAAAAMLEISPRTLRSSATATGYYEGRIPLDIVFSQIGGKCWYNRDSTEHLCAVNRYWKEFDMTKLRDLLKTESQDTNAQGSSDISKTTNRRYPNRNRGRFW
jgi:hypothetical protein